MKLRIILLALSGLAVGTSARAAATDAPVTVAFETIDVEGSGWIAEKDDNICGIADLKKVTKPAIVDYDKLLEATPQMKELKLKDIDPESVKGKTLIKGAQTLISKTAEVVREAKGHCGVWKAIAHKDERDVSDVTEDIVERF